MDKVAGGVIGVAVGIYLVRVGLAGNTKKLLQMLAKEGYYLEVLIALYALWILWKYGPAQTFTHQLMMAASIGVVLKTIGEGDKVSSVLTQFGNGQLTLFGAAKALFGG